MNKTSCLWMAGAIEDGFSFIQKSGAQLVLCPTTDCQKSLAEFAASAAKKVEIIFCRGVYLAENTDQAASVEFVCPRQANYARGRLRKTGGKARRGFSTSSSGAQLALCPTTVCQRTPVFVRRKPGF